MELYLFRINTWFIAHLLYSKNKSRKFGDLVLVRNLKNSQTKRISHFDSHVQNNQQQICLSLELF